MLAVLAGSTRATVVFFTNFGAAYTCAHHRRAGLHRATASRSRSCSSSRTASASSRRSASIRAWPATSRPRRKAEAAARARAGRDERRLQPAVQPRAVRRAQHARRAPVCAPGDGVEVVGVAKITGKRDRHRRHARGARDALPRRRDQLPLGPGQGRHPDQAAVRRRPRARLHRLDRRPRPDVVETSRGAEQTISTTKYEVTGRGGKGRELLQRGQFTRVIPTDAGTAAARLDLPRVPGDRRQPHLSRDRSAGTPDRSSASAEVHSDPAL